MIIRRAALSAGIALMASWLAPSSGSQRASSITRQTHVSDSATHAASSITDSLKIFYIGRPAGWEHYELTPADGGFALTSDYDYVDRGRRNHLQLTLTAGRDYALKTYESARLTDTSRTVTTSIALDGARATVRRGGKANQVTIPPVAYAVSSYSPTAQQLPLIRYWETHGMPATIAIVPGDPNPVAIAKRGVDTVGTGASRVLLTRYTTDGVLWGIKSLWLDTEGRLAMFATGGGGGLSFKTVRAALLPLREQLMDVATRAQMQELTRIASNTKPIAQGYVALVGATLIDATGAPATPNATVVVQNGRIVAAGASANTLRGQVNLGGIAVRVGQRFAERIAAGVRRTFRANEPPVVRTFRTLAARGTSTSFVFGEADVAIDTVERSMRMPSSNIAQLPEIDVRVIQNADHAFTTPSARAEQIDVLCADLTRRWPESR